MFVANPGNNSVTEYAPEVTGNVAPIATLAGSQTGLSKPQDLALDGSGRLLITNLSGSVTEYAPGAHGNAAPVARIAGSRTRLKQPHGIVIDPTGDVRVTNANGTVDTYAPNAKGNVAPVTQLTGGALTNPQGLNFDPSGQMVVADAGRGRVDTFAGSAGANGQPTRVLTGAPALQAPTGLDLDEPGDIFIADTAANRVLEFGPGSQNGASAMTDIAGPDTGLSRPAFLSELPPTPAPHLRVSTSRRQARKRILANGIVLVLKASGRLAFRGAPVLINAVARVGHVTVAQTKAAPLRPGKSVLRLIQTPRAARVLPRHGTKTIVVTVTVRDGSGRQTYRITVKCRG
ncbi:MAG: hypothetical protein JO027_02805 [Solirubrobacterales bacterium]|nr:hypothetical protein [Solirubrobacterales bacterium]